MLNANCADLQCKLDIRQHIISWKKPIQLSLSNNNNTQLPVFDLECTDTTGRCNVNLDDHRLGILVYVKFFLQFYTTSGVPGRTTFIVCTDGYFLLKQLVRMKRFSSFLQCLVTPL